MNQFLELDHHNESVHNIAYIAKQDTVQKSRLLLDSLRFSIMLLQPLLLTKCVCLYCSLIWDKKVMSNILARGFNRPGAIWKIFFFHINFNNNFNVIITLKSILGAFICNAINYTFNAWIMSYSLMHCMKKYKHNIQPISNITRNLHILYCILT